MKKLGWIAVSLLLVLLVGCERETPTPLPTVTPTVPAVSATPTASATRPTPTQPVATSTPTLRPTSTLLATLTPMPTATPSPEGRLLSVLTEVDFALPEGNVVDPQVAALDSEGDTLYVLGRANRSAPESVLGVLDPAAGRLRQVVPLPGSSYGPLVAGGRWICLVYSDRAYKGHLLLLSTDDYRALADLQMEGLYSGVGMALDAARRRLYLALQTRLEVRQATDLALLQTMPYEFQSSYVPQLAMDASAQRLYLALERKVWAYDTAKLAPLWSQTLTGRIIKLLLDGSRERLYAQTEDQGGGQFLESLEAATGKRLLEAKGGIVKDRWNPMAAGHSRVYALLSAAGRYDILALDPQGVPLAERDLGLYFFNSFLYDPVRERLYLLDSHNHLVRVLDPQSLKEIGQIVLGVEIRDIAAGEKQLYVNDSAGRLHILDAQSYKSVAQVQAGRGQPLVWDEAGRRLYVPVEEGGQEVAVFDAGAMTVTAVIVGGDRVAIDNIHQRLFIGQATSLYAPARGGVRVLDAKTLAPLHTIPRPGIPAYNPLRDEIYITDYTVYILDGQTYKELGELTPDIGAVGMKGCNGCPMARDVYVYPERDLLVADVTILSAGKGAGIYPPPRTFSLQSRVVLTYPVAASFTCGGKLALAEPINGVLYMTASFSRYVFFQNLVARQAGSGEALRWRDGVNGNLVVPQTGAIYSFDQKKGYALALDMEDWTPLGYIPSYCLHTLDLARQRLYATDGSRLIVLRDRGGQPLPELAAEPAPTLPAIQAIYVSPSYGEDRTLFVVGDGRILRSRDGGVTWMELRGGLPVSGYYSTQYDLALSPNYAEDRTIYAGAFAGEPLGYGVLRSTDGGDHWEMLWRGLDHLRVYDVVLSPEWARDGTLLAYARYERLVPQMESGESAFRSQDRGEHWELVAMRSSYDSGAPPLPKPEELLPIKKPLVQVAVQNYGRSVGRTWNGGRSWETVLAAPEDKGIIGVITAPDFPDKGTIYVAMGTALLRSTDHGDTWESATDPRLTQRTEWALNWRAMALAVERDMSHRLLLGDSAGHLLIVSPEKLAWERVAVPVPSPTTTPTATPSPTVPPRRLPTLTPTPCAVAPGGAFQGMIVRPLLGCPVAPAGQGFFATQPFERGWMFWREDERRIYVLTEDGRWQDLADTWSEGEPESDPALVAPQGRQQPVRGFGKVWREQLGGPQAAIGWALQPEVGYNAVWQVYERGLLLTDERGEIYALGLDGAWQRVMR